MEIGSLHIHNTISSKESFSRIFALLATKKVIQRKTIQMQTYDTFHWNIWLDCHKKNSLENARNFEYLNKSTFYMPQLYCLQNEECIKRFFFLSINMCASKGRQHWMCDTTNKFYFVSFWRRHSYFCVVRCAWSNTKYECDDRKIVVLEKWKWQSCEAIRAKAASILFNVRPLASTCFVDAWLEQLSNRLAYGDNVKYKATTKRRSPTYEANQCEPWQTKPNQTKQNHV